MSVSSKVRSAVSDTASKATSAVSDTASKATSAGSGVMSEPLQRLKSEAIGLAGSLVQFGIARFGDRIDSVTDRLNDVADGKPRGKEAGNGKETGNGTENGAEEDSPEESGGIKGFAAKAKDKLKDAVQKVTGGGKGQSGKLKMINIVEDADVPLPREVAYRQWTQLEDFPSFTKKVENVTQDSPEKTIWQAQIFWSHRRWTATVVDQVPNQHIVWKSEGQKGHVDGAVTFHELTPDLTRIHLVMEYYPKGLFERTGNIWRAQGRRARLELKHFVRNASMQTLLHQDEVEGWMGEIHDGEVVEDQQSEDSGNDQEQSDDSGNDQEGSEDSEEKQEASGTDENDQADEGNGSNRRRRNQKSSDEDQSDQESGSRKGNGSQRQAGASSGGRQGTRGRSTGSKRPASSGRDEAPE